MQAHTYIHIHTPGKKEEGREYLLPPVQVVGQSKALFLYISSAYIVPRTLRYACKTMTQK